MNFKDFHIGEIIAQAAEENGLDLIVIANFFFISEDEVKKMFQSKSLETDIVLCWSKLLGYDLFRIYTQHLILYSPAVKAKSKNTESREFIKNIYTREIIDFILELIKTGLKTKKQVIIDYKIPRVTLYRWIEKYGHQ